jgi:hypothetical protein
MYRADHFNGQRYTFALQTLAFVVRNERRSRRWRLSEKTVTFETNDGFSETTDHHEGVKLFDSRVKCKPVYISDSRIGAL